MNITLVLKNSDGTETEFDKILSFAFRKDIYQPYTSLSVKTSAETFSPENISEVKFFIDGRLIHHGLSDNITFTKISGGAVVSVSSRGFTSMLIQNQIATGLKSNISINTLMDGFYSLPYVTHEDNSKTSYIFVKSSSSMWDGIVNLSYKVCGTYPYIRGTNCVRMTAFENPSAFAYQDSEIISRGISETGRKLVSHFHMSDIEGNFGEFEIEDNDVKSLNIVRHRFIELDRQFLYNPQQALEYRSAYASRGRKRIFCTYSGYRGEDLYDTADFGSVSGERIGAVIISGNGSGVVTEISVYRDKFLSDGI
ncbi:MAG: hypothetical protein K2J08_04350 [Ruminococcus sp.]|nr:hypothetical protein [Ruminococcus sp.]